ncbi:hypothetical protein FB451DRAFT_1397921 [Mycena latifolia]|nr:hypothetical protein FB451DRAFT_1397921 [Mycena latifolia]
MHRALEIPEMVGEIVEKLCAGRLPLRRDDLRDLFALARTSTIFCNPALDVLWRHQDTILNLIQCMPDGLLDIALIEGQTSIVLRRPILREDWERHLFYLHRVKSFSMGPTLSPAYFIDTLCQSLGAEHLFPNLEKLHWHGDPTTKHFRLLLTPRIRHIFLGSIKTIHDLSVLLNLSARCTELTSVIILTSTLGHSAVPMTSAFVRGLTHVEALTVHGLDQLAIAHLAQLPRLKPSGELVSGAFSALQRLTFMRATLDCVTDFLAQTSNCPLVKFNIAALDPEPTEPTSRAFYAALARHCSQASLRDIRIVGDTLGALVAPNAQQIRAHAVVADTIRPLFCFSSLVSVRLVHPVGFDLDDSAILVMARAWPHVQFLSLTARPARHMSSRVTLQGVSAFAAHCPTLHTLELTFNATVVPEIHDISPRAAQESLSLIDVALSPIGAPHRVAEFLGGIFPRLTEIATLYEELLYSRHDLEGSEPHKRWKEVEENLSRSQMNT